METGTTARSEMTPRMVRISRALEIGNAFSHHDARDVLSVVRGMRPDENYIYILIAPMRVDAKRLDRVMGFLHKMAREEKCTMRISFSGNYEDAKAKGWFNQ
jgi:hypothetical protein